MLAESPAISDLVTHSQNVTSNLGMSSSFANSQVRIPDTYPSQIILLLMDFQ